MKTISYEEHKEYVDLIRSELNLENEVDFSLFLEFLRKKLNRSDSALIFRIIERGENLSEVARARRVSRQAVSKQMKKLLMKLKLLHEEFYK